MGKVKIFRKDVVVNLDPTKPPKDLDSAVSMLIDGMSDGDIDYVVTHDVSATHFGLGMYIRNTWHLWDKSTPLVKWFAKNLGIAHGDDTSGTVIAAMWHKVRGIPFDVNSHVEQYKEHWKQAGINPLEET